jgi:glycosyltransferase involved in cell wall biosynthesis
LSKKKLVVVDTVVDSLPTEGFLNRLDQVNAGGHTIGAAHETVFEIVYVGRLHREKLVGDLIKMMAVIAKSSGVCREIILTLIGEGPEQSFLEELASQLEVQGAVKFIGVIPNHQLPDYLCKAKAFVSPLTGTSLREAALCGLPIVAYNMDWVEGLFKHEETALLVSPGDYEGLARQVVRLSADEKLCKQLSANVKDLAWRLWTPRGIRESLQQAFKGN